jgi:uncharacterized membrane protein
MKRPAAAWLAGIVVVGTALRVWGLGSEPFWLDEAHSANYTRLSIGELWSFESPFDRVNPPGYILLLKIWSQAGRSDEWLRMSSVIAGILTIPVVYLIGRRIADRRLGLVSAAVVAVSGYHIRMSQEVRAYAAIALLTAVALLAVCQLLAEPDGDDATRIRPGRPWSVRSEGLGLNRPLTWTDAAWTAYALAAGVAFHLHNTGVAITLAANLAVGAWWLRSRPRPARFAHNWLLANVAVVLIWAPWVPGLITQLGLVTESWWVPAPTVMSVTESFATLVIPSFNAALPWSGRSIGAVVLVLATAGLVWRGIRSLEARFRVVTALFALVLPVMELVFSVRRPIFLVRTLVGVLVPVSVALAAAALRSRWPAVAAGVLAATVAVGSVTYHTSFEKTGWDEAAEWIATGAGTDDLILVQPGNTVVAFEHYFDGDQQVVSVPFRIPGREDRGSSVTESDRRLIAELAAGRTVWLVLNNPEGSESLEPLLTRLGTELTRLAPWDLDVVRFEVSP